MPLSPLVAQPALAAYAQAAERKVDGAGADRDAAVPKFGDVLANTISEAVDTSQTSENVSIRAASGQGDLQDVVEAVNAAEISLQTVVSIRDRVISAYQEIMRMPI